MEVLIYIAVYIVKPALAGLTVISSLIAAYILLKGTDEKTSYNKAS